MSPTIESLTGGYLNAVKLQDIKGVAPALKELLARVQALPFVPKDWTATVEKYQNESGQPWQPRYAIRADAWRNQKTGPLLADIPSWLADDVNAAVAWNKLADWWTEKLQPILAGWARDENVVLDEATNDAAFWNGLYTAVLPVAKVGDAILAAPEAVAGAASKVVTGTFMKLLPAISIVALVAIAVLVYKNKVTKG